MTVEERLKSANPGARVKKLRGQRFVISWNGRRVSLNAEHPHLGASWRSVLCMDQIPLMEIRCESIEQAVAMCKSWLSGVSFNVFRASYPGAICFDDLKPLEMGEDAYLEWRWNVVTAEEDARMAKFLRVCREDSRLSCFLPFTDCMMRVWMSDCLYRFGGLLLYAWIDAECGGNILRDGVVVFCAWSDECLVDAWSLMLSDGGVEFRLKDVGASSAR